MRDYIQAQQQRAANQDQIDVLKQHFPQCFDRDGKFLTDRLNEIVTGEGVELSHESYSLNWLGKSYAHLLTHLPSETLLAPNLDHNQSPENAKSKNLLIEGDNLDVLKHLKHAYYNKVKMIYIDPPYNTGSDGFVYQDDRKFTKAELAKLADISEDEAARILKFTQSKSNSHSAWLTFIYPRLYIARQLLREDGVIFISIDDNEQAQLKLLCDDIFGPENFVGNILWEKRYGRSNNAKIMTPVTEHILLYQMGGITMLKETRSEKQNKGYSNPDGDKRGVWTSVSFINQVTKEARPNLAYSITNPITGKTINHPTNAWKVSKEKYDILLKENRLYWGESGNAAYPRIKRFLSELDEGMVPVNFWRFSEAGTADYGTKEIKNLMNCNAFNFPKPTLLIQKMLSLYNHSKFFCESPDIILDFFAGSGTTAHAVMALNAEDGGNRQFILVQIAEPTDKKSEAHKAGYQTIYQITKERIKRAAAKIKADHPLFSGDLGFQEYKVISAHEGRFQGYLVEADNQNDFQPFNGLSLPEDIQTLLRTWAVYDGVELTTAFTPVDLAGYRAYQADHIVYFMDKGLKDEAIKELLNRLDNDANFTPRKLVVFHYNQNETTLRALKEAIHHYQNHKQIELTLDERF